MFVPLGDGVRLPTRGTSWSCGYDLYTPERVSIPPFQAVLVDLKIKCEIPSGFYGTLHLRSSAWNVGVVLLCGVIGSREIPRFATSLTKTPSCFQIQTSRDPSAPFSGTFREEERWCSRRASLTCSW